MIKILYEFLYFLHIQSTKSSMNKATNVILKISKICGAPHSIARFPSTFQYCVLPSSAL